MRSASARTRDPGPGGGGDAQLTLHFASADVSGQVAAAALEATLAQVDPGPLAREVRDHDDGSGLWEVGAYFDGPPDAVALALLAAAHGATHFRVSRVAERDWVAQVRAELTPVAAGRFVVYGSHDRARAPVNRIGLEIEAAQAFGTGHHATTQGCLLAAHGLARHGYLPRNVADIGGGTGVLAMAAAALWRTRATVGDIDPLAVRTARENAAANGLSGLVQCVTAAGFNHPTLQTRGPYDLVFANILAAPLRRLAPHVARNQAATGVVVLSGLLTRQAPAVRAVYSGWGYRRMATIVIGEWSTLVLRRAS